jgi:lipopolysaccharide/colanic/teichoic acid biosynthesis glycosyltransferase
MRIVTKENAANLNEDPNIAQKPQIQILFIKSTNLHAAENLEFYRDSIFVDSFKAAENYLQNVDISMLPDLTVIDIPLNFKDLTVFKAWISENFIPPIPIIYNEDCLSVAEADKLHSLNIVDDVININYNSTVLYYKSIFFKKLFVERKRESLKKKEEYKSFAPAKTSFIKRLIDVILSFTIILLVLPVFLLIMLLIKFETKGPAIYRSKRAGKGFHIFDFYKFRTMITDADKKVKELNDLNLYSTSQDSPQFFKVANDPRITKVGTFLRNTSLDELPQLFNVLKGDMSIVGNRPLPLYEAATLTTDEWAERFMAPAGITGLWQVKKRGQKEMSNEERVELDINYARNNTLARDFWIIAKTPSALIQKENV